MHRFGAKMRWLALSGCKNGVKSMSFFNSTGLDDLARRLADSVPESLRAFGRDLEGNFRAVLQAQLSKLDLVSRQEFDVQAAILERTRAKLAELEARLKELEARVAPQ
jgi:ubiquinone biosynthesis accessory factor UbiK